ncbi:unnamed protein product [Urochloa humidicola]
MPSSSLMTAQQRWRHRRPLKSVTLPLPVFHFLVQPPPDWAEGLPLDVLLCIFHRLDHVQIMMGADKVCCAWRRAAREEPELYRRIDMRGHSDLACRGLADLDKMAAVAVRRSRGECRSFWGEYAGNKDRFLIFLAHQAPLLKSLTLISCNVISRRGFKEAIKMFPLLEELQISDCWKISNNKVLKVVAQACPRLKHLRCHHPYWINTDYEFLDMEAMKIAMMHELRSLQLFHNQLTNEGLSAILDGCPHLESLDIRSCHCIDLHDDAIRTKCARIKTKKLYAPKSHAECEDFEPASPIISKWRPRKYPKPWTCLDRDDYADYYDPCYGLDSLDEIGLEVHDRMLCKRARRYLIMGWTGIM